ncbi:hypothetical protein GCM10027040_21390 [Halomonas shantousis]
MSVNKKTGGRRRTATQARERARRFGVRLQGVTREGVIIVLLALCVFLLLALFSYNPGDPGWSHSGPEQEVSNWMGTLGAWLADVLYSLLGASALWGPGMLGFAAWRLMRSRQVNFEWDPTVLAIRTGGLMLLLLSTTTLGDLHFYQPDSDLPYAAGGILGRGLAGTLQALVDVRGATLLALAAFMSGFTLFTGMSWLTVMDELGERAHRLFHWVRGRFTGMRDKREMHRDADEDAMPADTDEAANTDAESVYAHDDTRHASWWQRLMPRRRTEQPAYLQREPELAGGPRVEPSLQDTFAQGSDETQEPSWSAWRNDGNSDIPWDMPERTPSAKQPAAAYSARQAQEEGPTREAARVQGGDMPPSSIPERTPPLAASAAEGEAKPQTAVADARAGQSESRGDVARRRFPESIPEPMLADDDDDDELRAPWSAPIQARRDDEETPGGQGFAAHTAQPETAPVHRDAASRHGPGAEDRSRDEAEFHDEAAASRAASSGEANSPSVPAAADSSTARQQGAEAAAVTAHEPQASDISRTEDPVTPARPRPRVSWDDAESDSPAAATPTPRSASSPAPPAPQAPAPQASTEQPPASPLSVAPPEPEETHAPQPMDEAYGRMASAEQARAAAEDPEGPTLWTVEHLQSQRPVLDDLPEPDGTLPSLQLLTPADPHQPNYTPEQLADMAELLEVRLREYGVKAEVVETWPGPVITRFEIKPAAGVKVSKISNLAKDLARSLMVKSVRVVEIIPGRPTVGIEIPNPNRAMIRLREVIDSDAYQQAASPLTLALGHDIGGSPVVANLGKMPHLLVAGTTGSGKSVGVNGMLISMLLKATPEEVRMIMVDPKMLELSVYDGIPHLLAPVVTDMKEAANGLRWCVAEMERRYKLMASMGVRNIAGFNAKLDEAERAGAQVADPLWEPQPWQMHEQPPVLEKLPYIVVVIDEFADMFMIVGKKVEELIARLAQKARAAGIHLILATQRPSVDVVTGLIKANIPTRMAFQVSSKVDSRTILDQGGAENLLGHGDMLYLPAGAGMPTRVHGAFVDDDEVHRVVEDWKRRGEPEYIEEILSGGVSAEALTGLEAEGGEADDAEQDAIYDEAVQFVTESRRASISAVQRRFKIGYNRAARLVESMEMAGVVSSMGSNGSREVLAPPPVGE